MATWGEAFQAKGAAIVKTPRQGDLTFPALQFLGKWKITLPPQRSPSRVPSP